MPLSDIIVEDGRGLPNATTIQTNQLIDEFTNSRFGMERWISLDANFKKKCNITAMDCLNQLRWRGRKSFSHQALAFPRFGLTDQDGTCFPANCIPDAIFFAHARLAIMMGFGSFIPKGLQIDPQVKSLSAEGVSMSFAKPVQLSKNGCGDYTTSNPLDVIGEEAKIFLQPRITSVKMLRA